MAVALNKILLWFNLKLNFVSIDCLAFSLCYICLVIVNLELFMCSMHFAMSEIICFYLILLFYDIFDIILTACFGVHRKLLLSINVVSKHLILSYHYILNYPLLDLLMTATSIPQLATVSKVQVLSDEQSCCPSVPWVGSWCYDYRRDVLSFLLCVMSTFCVVAVGLCSPDLKCARCT